MAKLMVNMFLTVDGVLQGPGAPEEDREGGFEHGGWVAEHWDDTMGEVVTGQITGARALLLGRRTYEIFAAHWPHHSGDPVSDTLNSMPKYVASRTLQEPGWHPVTVLRDAATEVAALKEELEGTLLVNGSQHLLQSLIAEDLVDTYVIWTFPLLLGTGKRLFAQGTRPAALRLTDRLTSSTGVTITTYERAGEVVYGTVAS